MKFSKSEVAKSIPFDNSSNGFTAVTVQDGIQEASAAATSRLDPQELINISYTSSAAANAVTFNIKTASGANNPSSTDPCRITFRDTTVSSAALIERTITAATSLTIPSGATLGHTSGGALVYIYLINSGSTTELAVSGSSGFSEDTLYSTTALSAASDSEFVLYSTTARTSRAIRLIGSAFFTPATPGNWAVPSIANIGINNLSVRSVTGASNSVPFWTGSRTITGNDDVFIFETGESLPAHMLLARRIQANEIQALESTYTDISSAYFSGAVAAFSTNFPNNAIPYFDFLSGTTSELKHEVSNFFYDHAADTFGIGNLRMTANTLSSSSGALILNSAATGIQMSDPVEMAANALKFGASNDAQISFATNLLIDPNDTIAYIGDGSTPSNLQAMHIGLGGNAPTTTRIINIAESSTTVTNAVFTSYTYTGSTALPVTSLKSTLIHGGSNTNPSGINQVEANNTVNPSGLVTMVGLLGVASAGVASTQGTRIYDGVRGSTDDGSFTHTGGSIAVASIKGNAPAAFAGGATVISWAGNFDGDLQISSNAKLILEGSTVSKGDTYLSYVTASTAIQTFVNGTQYSDLSSAGLKLPTVGEGFYVKEGTNATMGTATLVGGTVTVNTTKVTANSRIFVFNNSNAGTDGRHRITARTAGTSFTVTSSSGTDTSVIAWIIFEPA